MHSSALKAALVMCLVLLATMSCAKQETAASETSSSAAATTASCEHGVEKSVCPKCNPALAAVFQAKGDWCGEHGFPESFCPLCHPERDGRPTAKSSGDEAPADKLKVKLTSVTEKRAGILTVPATTRASNSRVSVTARLGYNATKHARLNARAPGVVRTLEVDVGSMVKKGAVLLTLDSAMVGADRARLGAANSRLAVATSNYERVAQLRRDNITSEKEVLAVSQELAAAKGEVAALSASLSVIGASAGSGGGYTLRAPFDGVVTERSATMGTLVQTDQVLLEVVDTSTLWAELDVPEAELRQVRVGQLASLSVDSLPDQVFAGTIVYLAPSIDPHTRTTRARVDLDNAEGLLRANMFGRATIGVGGEASVVVVPRAAVQRAKGVSLAFVRIGSAEFETRRLTLGFDDGEFVEVRSGIAVNEQVVTTGSFLLKTETLKESIGAGCCETD